MQNGVLFWFQEGIQNRKYMYLDTSRVKYDIETALLRTLVSMFNKLFHAQFSSAANHVRGLKRLAVKRLFGISILNSVDRQDKFRVQS